VAGERAVKVQHIIHVPPPPPAPPGCADLDSHCAQVRHMHKTTDDVIPRYVLFTGLLAKCRLRDSA
jgi:hypothetical protein